MPDRARPQRRDVHGRRLRLPDDHLTVCRSMTVTTPARTWLDCAQYLPVEHLIAMGDAVLRRGLATDADLHRMIAWGRGRRGVAIARLSLPHLDPRSESPGESLARAHLVLAGVPRPECNADIIENGEWLARADMRWRKAKLIVEYDGAVHLGEESAAVGCHAAEPAAGSRLAGHRLHGQRPAPTLADGQPGQAGPARAQRAVSCGPPERRSAGHSSPLGRLGRGGGAGDGDASTAPGPSAPRRLRPRARGTWGPTRRRPAGRSRRA